MNEGSLPDELNYTLSSASPNEALRRLRATLGSAGTEAVDILGLVQEGTKLYYSPAAVRSLRVAIAGVIAIAGEQPPERLHTRRLRADYHDSGLVAFRIGEDAHLTNPTIGLSASSSTSAKEAVDTHQSKEPEVAAAEARQQWQSRFRARVRLMEKLLINAPDDSVPTPRGDDDD